MNIEEIRIFCLSKSGATESFPFDDQTLVFKAGGKMFALLSLGMDECRVNLKCDPGRALELREEYPGDIIPGFHMNKDHWNSVYTERGLEDRLIMEMIDHSYNLVVKSLPKKIREEFGISS
jgi:predicted DNA-binding protein (MmcQ/YjbR family)